jgi:hypothetical protein
VPWTELFLRGIGVHLPERRHLLVAGDRLRDGDGRLLVRMPERQHVHRILSRLVQLAVHRRQHLHADGRGERQHRLRSLDLHAHSGAIGLGELHQRRDLSRHLHRRVVLAVLRQRLDLRSEVPRRRDAAHRRRRRPVLS